MIAKTRIPPRAAAALCALAALCATQRAVAQDADNCQARVQTLAETHGVPLRVVLGRLGDEARADALKWADCASGHLGVAMVYEQSIRAADAQAEQGHTLYISPSQQVRISDPEGAFARSQLVAQVNAVAEARALAAPLLGPPAGAATWSATLTDLNAETHALRATTALAQARLLTPQEAALQSRQTATALLITTAYIHHAQQAQPAVFGRLAAAPESVDALGVLTARAVEALTAASKLGADADTDAILKGMEPHAPALEALFKQAGLQAPALAIPRTPAAPVAQANDTPPAPQPDNTPSATAPPPGNTDAPDAGAANAPKATDAPDAGADSAPKAPADTPDAGSDSAGNADAGAAGTPAAPGADAQQEGLSTAHQVRIGLGALALLLPWILIGIIAATKRRKPAFYQRLANRTVAIATLLMVFEALALLLAGVLGSLSALLTLDALFLLFAPYMLAVSVLMLARLDTEDQLASRQLFKRWGKWLAVGFGVILVANAVLIPTIFVLTPHFIVLPSMMVVALVAIIFLIKLWRTGNAPEAPEAAPSEEPEASKPEEKQPEPKKPEAKKPEPKQPEAKQPEARKPEPKQPAAPAPRPAQPRPADVDNEGDADAPDPNSKSAQMSDDELARALEGFGATGTSAPRKPAAPQAERKRPQMSNDDLLKAFEGLESAGGDSGGDGALSDEDRARLARLLDD